MTPSAVTRTVSNFIKPRSRSEVGDSLNKASEFTKAFLFTECIIPFLRRALNGVFEGSAGRVDQSGTGVS